MPFRSVHSYLLLLLLSKIHAQEDSILSDVTYACGDQAYPMEESYGKGKIGKYEVFTSNSCFTIS